MYQKKNKERMVITDSAQRSMVRGHWAAAATQSLAIIVIKEKLNSTYNLNAMN